jgi:hypothetical protein
MIDKNKKYQLRNGRPAEVYKTTGLGSFPILGSYLTPSGESRACQWTSEGSFLSCKSIHDFDLVEVKPRIVEERWVNVYPDGATSFHSTRQKCDEVALQTRIACVKVTIDCEHGEGLEHRHRESPCPN